MANASHEATCKRYKQRLNNSVYIVRIKLRKGLMALTILLLLPLAFLWRKLVFKAQITHQASAAAPHLQAANHRERAIELSIATQWISNRLRPKPNCLSIALAGQWVMRAWGISTHIRIAVRRAADGEIASHAWLLHDDLIITGGENDQRFREIWKSPQT